MKQSRLLLLPLAGLLLLVLFACSGPVAPVTKPPSTVPPTKALPPADPTSTPGPTAPASEPPQPAGAVLLREDFSDPKSGWERRDFAEGSTGYEDGHYFVEAAQKDKMIWGVASQHFSDIVIEVEATQVEAPENDNNAYGLMCRAQRNGDGYLLRISGDGYYAIHRVVGDDFEALVDWEASSAIYEGYALNYLRAVCDGSHLALYVNGELVAETTDTTFAAGDIALTATTYEAEERTVVHFDNLVVLEVGDQEAP